MSNIKLMQRLRGTLYTSFAAMLGWTMLFAKLGNDPL
jgi:hypothetical protein